MQIEEIEDNTIRDYLEAGKETFLVKWENPARVTNTLKYQELKKLKTIGYGSFGRVFLMSHKNFKQLFAVKVLEKGKIVKLKQVEHTLAEKKILSCIEFPNIVRYLFSSKNNSYLYLGLELVKRGELFYHLRKALKFKDILVKFYAAQVVLVFEYLHFLDITYRDLKPENLLLDQNGYIKVTDFGFAKMVKHRTWTLCGTPEYLAPEIILSKGYNKSVDWWALGVLIYEMSAGYSPFGADEPIKVYEKVVKGKFKYPKHFKMETKDIIARFLQQDLTKRLGNMYNGIDDIKEHPFFDNTDWVSIFEQNMVPPFIPPVKNTSDITNYETQEEEDMPVSATEEYSREFREW